MFVNQVAILTGESFARKLVYKVGGQMATKTSVKIIPGIGSIIAATMATQMTYAVRGKVVCVPPWRMVDPGVCMCGVVGAIAGWA